VDDGGLPVEEGNLSLWTRLVSVFSTTTTKNKKKKRMIATATTE
jgi:hypothetical protein